MLGLHLNLNHKFRHFLRCKFERIILFFTYLKKQIWKKVLLRNMFCNVFDMTYTVDQGRISVKRKMCVIYLFVHLDIYIYIDRYF